VNQAGHLSPPGWPGFYASYAQWPSCAKTLFFFFTPDWQHRNAKASIMVLIHSQSR